MAKEWGMACTCTHVILMSLPIGRQLVLKKRTGGQAKKPRHKAREAASRSTTNLEARTASWANTRRGRMQRKRHFLYRGAPLGR